jgi:hypothetical protein
MTRLTTDAPRIADVRETVETWRREARELTYQVGHPVDLEWLGGRIAALGEVLGLLDGAPPSVDARTRLLGD